MELTLTQKIYGTAWMAVYMVLLWIVWAVR